MYWRRKTAGIWNLKKENEDLKKNKENISINDLTKLKKVWKELGKEIEEVEKRIHPSSFSEAMEISKYWGMEVQDPIASSDRKRYMIVNNTHVMGLVINCNGAWASSFETMEDYWAGKGTFRVEFYPFNSAKELYLWMAEEDSLEV